MARVLPLSAQTAGAAQPLAGIVGFNAIACPAAETCYGVGVGGVVTIANERFQLPAVLVTISH